MENTKTIESLLKAAGIQQTRGLTFWYARLQKGGPRETLISCKGVKVPMHDILPEGATMRIGDETATVTWGRMYPTIGECFVGSGVTLSDMIEAGMVIVEVA